MSIEWEKDPVLQEFYHLARYAVLDGRAEVALPAQETFNLIKDIIAGAYNRDEIDELDEKSL